MGKKSVTFSTIEDNFVHDAVKKTLAHCNKETAVTYGKIYRKIWKAADEAKRKEIESEYIQDLMHLCVFGKSPISLKIRLVLEAFSDHKKYKAVDNMLCRLLEPFIWRGLKALNGEVRMNSVQLFLLLFPMRNNELKAAENELLLQRQVDSFEVMLTDAVPCIRAASVIGICGILDVYWEILPPRSIKSVLDLMVSNLAFDSSNLEVRESVFKGLKRLTTNSRSHTMLKKVLPKLSLAIHDSAEIVRSAFIKMLFEIKKINFMKYWDVVDMNHILARLAIEQSNVIKKLLVELIFKSYCQENGPIENRLGRFIFLIQSNLSAARCFFYYAPDFDLTLDYIVESILIMLRCVYSCVKNAKQKDETTNSSVTASEERSEVESETETSSSVRLDFAKLDVSENNVPTPALTVDNIVVICGLFECSAIFWRRIGSRLTLTENTKLYNRLVKISSKIVQECFIFFDNNRLIDVLLDMATLFRPSAVPYLAASIFKKLKMIEDTDHNDDSIIRGLLKAACFWRFNELADTITIWLARCGDLESSLSAVGTPTKKRSRRIKFASSSKRLPVDPKPRLALRYLEFLVNDHECRSYILREHPLWLLNFSHKLDDFLLHYNAFKSDDSNDNTDKIGINEILLAERLQSSIRMLLTSKVKELSVDDTASFLKSKILYHEFNTLPELKNDSNRNVAEQFILQLYLVLRNALMLNTTNDSLLEAICAFSQLILDNSENSQIFVELSSLLYNIVDFLHYCDENIFDVEQKLMPLISAWCDRFIKFITEENSSENQQILRKSCFETTLQTLDLLVDHENERIRQFAKDYLEKLRPLKATGENK